MPKRGSGRTRNTPFILTFTPAVRHYADIHASEDNSFGSDEIAKKFVAASRNIYPHALSSLVEKGNAYKLQCVILTNDVGYAAAAFVIRDFKPSTVVIILPS